MAESLPESRDKLLSHLGVLVKGLKVISLLGARISAHGGDIDHAIAELDKGTPLHRDVQVGNVVKAEVCELLVLVLADPLDEAVAGHGLAELVGRQAILGEAEVEEGGDGDASGLAQLLLLLDEVGAADETDGALGS